MVSITRVGVLAAGVIVGLSLTALPVSAGKVYGKEQDRSRERAFSKAIAKAKAGERQAKALMKAKKVGGKRITNTTIPCTAGTGDEAALRDAVTVAVGDATTIHNLILGSGCTYTLSAEPDFLSAETSIMITGNGATIVAFGGTRHFTVLVGGVLRIYNTILRGTDTDATGGIENQGSLTFYGSTATLNRSGVGGGIFNSGDAGIYNSVISSNQAVMGGGIFSGRGYLVVSNTAVSSNTATGPGGGLDLSQTLATVNNTFFSANTAFQGGGTSIGEQSVLNAYGSLWSNNIADFIGGAIWNTQGFYGRSIGITGNYANTSGGVFNEPDAGDSQLNLDGGYVTANSSVRGAGIYSVPPNAISQAVVSGTDVSGNTPINCFNVTGC